MRPNKPGCYWWKDTNGKPHVAEFEKMGDDLFTELYEMPSDFEVGNLFARWIGPAHPPKMVQRYEMETVLGSQIDMVDREDGHYVKYEDVAEYLLPPCELIAGLYRDTESRVETK